MPFFVIPAIATGAKVLASQLAIRGGAKVLGRTVLNYMNKNGLDKAIARYGKSAVNKIQKITKESKTKPVKTKRSSTRSDDNSLIKRTSAQEKKIKDAKDAAKKAREEKLRKAAAESNRKKLKRQSEQFAKDASKKAKEATDKKSALTVREGTSRALTITKQQNKDFPLVVQRMSKNTDVKKLLNNPSKLNTARLKKLEEGLEKGFPRNKLMNKIMAASTVGSIGALLLQDDTKTTKADKPDRGVTRKERKIDHSSDYSRASSDYRSRGTGSGSNRDALAKAKRPSYFQDIDAKSSSRKSKDKDKDKDKDDSSNVRTGSGGNVRTGSGGKVKTDRKKRKRPYDPSMMGIRMGRNFQSGGLVKADKYFKRGASSK
jgi:hypothetical protein